jgi:hypothetical protein
MTMASPQDGSRRRWPPFAALGPTLVAALALLLLACTAQLAPSYDDYIDNNLTRLSQTIETYYAAMPAAGYSRESFPKQEAFYADTLGKIEALKTRAAARPVPESGVTRFFGMQQKPNGAVGIGNEIPTVANLNLVADALQQLRDTQRTSGLSPSFAQRTIEQIRIALRNAITYEMALKR